MTQELHIPVVANDNTTVDTNLSSAVLQTLKDTHAGVGNIIDLADFEASQINPIRFYLEWVRAFVMGSLGGEPDAAKYSRLIVAKTQYRERQAANDNVRSITDTKAA